MFILGFSHVHRLQDGISCIAGIKLPTEQEEGCIENIGRECKEYIITVDLRSGTQDRTRADIEPGISVDSKCQQGSERSGRLFSLPPPCSFSTPAHSSVWGCVFLLHSKSG